MLGLSVLSFLRRVVSTMGSFVHSVFPHSVFLYHWENKNYVLFVFPSHIAILLNLCALSETLFCINSRLGGLKPSWHRLCVRVYPIPLII
jgi:hypothetical protein